MSGRFASISFIAGVALFGTLSSATESSRGAGSDVLQYSTPGSVAARSVPVDSTPVSQPTHKSWQDSIYAPLPPAVWPGTLALIALGVGRFVVRPRIAVRR